MILRYGFALNSVAGMYIMCHPTALYVRHASLTRGVDALFEVVILTVTWQVVSQKANRIEARLVLLLRTQPAAGLVHIACFSFDHLLVVSPLPILSGPSSPSSS